MKKTTDIRIRDPYIVAKNGTYYLYSSSVEEFSNSVCVYKSTDLTNWQEPIPVYTIDTSGWKDYDLWASEVHEYNDKYYLFVSIMGKSGLKPIVGLPGHPVAAYFITKLFVLPLLSRLMGREQEQYTTTAKITESIGANHGRAQYQCCRLERREGELFASPIRGKSGLITTLAGADGYFCIDRDCEGLPRGAEIQVTVTLGD